MLPFIGHLAQTNWTLLWEGDHQDCHFQEQNIYQACQKVEVKDFQEAEDHLEEYFPMRDLEEEMGEAYWTNWWEIHLKCLQEYEQS